MTFLSATTDVDVEKCSPHGYKVLVPTRALNNVVVWYCSSAA